jgi:hypothetical protein
MCISQYLIVIQDLGIWKTLTGLILDLFILDMSDNSIISDDNVNSDWFAELGKQLNVKSQFINGR